MRTLLILTACLTACSDYNLHSEGDELGGDETDSTEPEDSTEPTEPTEPSEPEVPDCAEFEAPADFGVAIDETCMADFSDVGLIDPIIEWTSSEAVSFADTPDATSPYTMPAVANINDDNGDGVIDERDVPDIVYTAFDAWKTQPGHLRVISGDGSGEVWSVHAFEYEGQTHYPSCLGGSAVGDLDGDGRPEVVTITSGGAVVAFEADGQPRWVSSGISTSLYAQPSLADLDGDGQAEVVVGNILLETDGSLRGEGTAGYGVPATHVGSWGPISIPVDLDGDGWMEVVAGDTIYDDQATTLVRSGLSDGYTAVGDLDNDGDPEIVTVQYESGEVYLWETDGTVSWRVATGSGGGGPPTLADFDGDGEVEIGVAGYSSYVVLEPDGDLLWSAAITDASSSATGSAVFDFDGNGAAEVVFADEIAFYVFDGATGAVLYLDTGHSHGTAWEYPVIADVDRDGNSEIIVGSAASGSGSWDGITVLGSASESWAPSRPVWNQHAYHITNVTNDGGIPQSEEPNWAVWNNFRAAGTELGPLHWRPNLLPGDPEICTLTCELNEITLYLRAGNGGLLDTEAGVELVLEQEDGTVVWSGTLSALLSGEGSVLGPLTLSRDDWGGQSLYLRIDPGDALAECDEEDNLLDLGSWPCP